jgi:ech hydrogenase subunit A
MALEAAARNLPAMIGLALGSTLTVMYWARWAGTLVSQPLDDSPKPERLPTFTWIALAGLCLGAVFLSVAAPWLYQALAQIQPGSPPAFQMQAGTLANESGAFAVFPLCLAAGLGFLLAAWAVVRSRRARRVSPYLSGVQDERPGWFTGPMSRPVQAEAANYYFDNIFGERRLTLWVNAAALLLLMLLVGGALP